MSRSSAAAPLRVLHLLPVFDGDGLAQTALAVINRCRKGYSHALVSADPARRGAAAGFGKGVTAPAPPGFPALDRPFSLRHLQTLAREMQGFDLILTYGEKPLDAALAHALFGPGLGLAPLVHHAGHGVYGEDPGEQAVRRGLVGRWYRRLALSRASAVIAPSPAVESMILRNWHQPRGKVHLVRDGVDIAALATRPRRDALPRVIKRPGEKWLLALPASINAQLALVRAAASLDDDWQLVVAGDVSARDDLIAEAMRLGIRHRLHFAGPLHDPSAVVALFDLVVVPEATAPVDIQANRVLIMAMAAGLAIVAAEGGTIPDLVGRQNAAHLLPNAGSAQEREQALSQKLSALAHDTALRDRIGEENRVRARSEFDRAAMAERLAGIYSALLS